MEKSNINKAANANRYSPDDAPLDTKENREDDDSTSTNSPPTIQSNRPPSTWTKRLHSDFMLVENEFLDMDNLILKITECQKHGMAILLKEHKDLAIFTNATGEAGRTVLLHDYDWFDDGDVENSSLHHVILSGIGKTSNIFTFHPDKAFAKSRNVHMPK